VNGTGSCVCKLGKRYIQSLVRLHTLDLVEPNGKLIDLGLSTCGRDKSLYLDRELVPVCSKAVDASSGTSCVKIHS
jgi:hypothetical protein